MDPTLRRVVVVGTSCCGKTSFASRLARLLGAPHVELDALHWGPDWTEKPAEEFRRLVEEAVAGERWIVDGNYTIVRDAVWSRATSIVWLNYPFALVFARALRRTIRRALFRERLFAGNRESLLRSFFTRESILYWVLTTFRRRRRAYGEIRRTALFPQLRWIEFRRPADADRFLESFARAGSVESPTCSACT